MRARGVLILALLAGSLGPAGVARPADQATPRLLGGYQFIPSGLVPDPFIATSLQSTTGGGNARNIDVPLYDVQGNDIGDGTASIGLMNLGIDYQQRISNRVDVRFSLNGGGRLGTSAASILSEGLSAIYGYGIGVTVNLTRQRNWVLAAAVDARGNTLYGVSPLGFVQSVIDNIALGDSSLASSEDSLLDKGDNSRYVAGLRGAWTPAPWIGFTGYFEAGVGKVFRGQEANKSLANFGVTSGFDFNPLTQTPVGVLLQYKHESLNERDENVGRTDYFGFTVAYTGRHDFAVGIESFGSKIHQPRTSKSVDAVLVRLLMRYDFR